MFKFVRVSTVALSYLFSGVAGSLSAADSSVTLQWDPNPESSVAGYRVYYGASSRNYAETIEVTGSVTVATVFGLENDQRYFFAVTAFDDGGLESPFSEEVSAMAVQTPEDHTDRIVLTNAAAGNSQFSITSSPSHGTVSYVEPELNYTPTPDFYGRDRFDLVSIDANSNSIPFAILVSVASVNDTPTLDPLADMSIDQNPGPRRIALSGISSGAGNEEQMLTLSAVSSAPLIIPNPEISYTSPNTEGTLTFGVAPDASGTAIISVTVNDGDVANNFLTRSFTVRVGGGTTLSNTPPIVNAGADASAAWPSSVDLAGSVSDDGLPNPPGAWSASWSEMSGPGSVTFTAPNSPVSSATFSQAGTYILRLTATDGELSASDDVQVQVYDNTGPQVLNFSVASADARTIAFTFTTDEPALCSIEYGNTSDLGRIADEGSLATNHYIVLTNLEPATNYFVHVRSIDQASNTSVTATMTASTPPFSLRTWAAEAGDLTEPMAVGTNVSALNGRYVTSPAVDQGSVFYAIEIPIFSNYRIWCRVRTPNADVGSFYATLDQNPELLVDAKGAESSGAWQWVTLKSGGDETWALNLEPGLHQFAFRAHDAGVFLDAFILSNDPDWVPDVGATPPVLTATGISSNRIDLSWTETLTNEEGVQIEVSADGISFVNGPSIAAGITSCSFTGLASSTTYYFRLYAFSQTERTEYSNIASARTGDIAMPPFPPTATKATFLGRHVTISWQDTSTNESGFTVERSNDGVSFLRIRNTGTNVTSTRDSPPRGRYYYRVRSFNAAGSSAPSNVATVDVQ